MIFTSAGSSNFVINVSGTASEASRLSTGLMQWALTAAFCPSLKVPLIT